MSTKAHGPGSHGCSNTEFHVSLSQHLDHRTW